MRLGVMGRTPGMTIAVTLWIGPGEWTTQAKLLNLALVQMKFGRS
jgi:hypothetical protein